jgi:hypothetical protein
MDCLFPGMAAYGATRPRHSAGCTSLPTTVTALLSTFARTETKGFHREIWERADALFFFEGRLRFYHVDGSQGGSANAPSCLVA